MPDYTHKPKHKPEDCPHTWTTMAAKNTGKKKPMWDSIKTCHGCGSEWKNGVLVK